MFTSMDIAVENGSLSGEPDDMTEDMHVEVEVEVERMRYTITQNPPIPVTLCAALQHILMNLAFGLLTAFIVADVLCAPYDSPVRTRLFSSTLFMSGVCTLLQTGLGVRLPLYQGPSASFFPALLALQNNREWKCVEANTTVFDHKRLINETQTDLSSGSLTEEQKLQKLSGSLMLASLFEILIGATGLVGVLLRYIGPVTIGPTIALIGLSLYKIPIAQSQASWEIPLCGVVITLFFALYIPHLRIPLPIIGKKRKRSYFPLFQLLPVLLTILLMWGVCGILTVTNVFPDDPNTKRYKARTDSKISLITETPWFLLPYPGQFGFPAFSFAAFVGFLTGFCASMIESVGDYFAAAKACEVEPPPDHAVNRGILMEGLAGLLGGAIGTGHATTSYSGNISAITMTKTASRSILLCCGLQLLALSILGKIGAAIALIPDPALAGVIVVLCGMLISLGLSTLRHVDMDSTRNVAIVGVTLFVGICLPEWVDRYPDFINTGVEELDGVLKVALGTPMFVGGVISILLDNTVRGTQKARGLQTWRQKAPSVSLIRTENDDFSPVQKRDDISVSSSKLPGLYEWSWLPSVYKRCKYLHMLPFMPPKKHSILKDATT